MLGAVRRGTLGAKRPVASLSTQNVLNAQQTREISDKALRSRMVAVTNIKKITKAMKMVASAKVRRAEEGLNVARNFGKGIADVFPEQQVEALEDKPTSGRDNILLMPITPDRGLCGSVNGAVVRATRARGQYHLKAHRKMAVIGLGEKTRAGLERLFAPQLVATFGEHSKLKRRTFKSSTAFADLLLRTPHDNIEIIHNTFKNMISFDTKTVGLPTFTQAMSDASLFEPYEIDGNPDVMENLYEFTIAVKLHSYLAESDMVEFSQRVNSMSNSSKNAEGMLTRLRLLYNRNRQARITTELVEIISGATAAAEQVQ